MRTKAVVVVLVIGGLMGGPLGVLAVTPAWSAGITSLAQADEPVVPPSDTPTDPPPTNSPTEPPVDAPTTPSVATPADPTPPADTSSNTSGGYYSDDSEAAPPPAPVRLTTHTPVPSPTPSGAVIAPTVPLFTETTASVNDSLAYGALLLSAVVALGLAGALAIRLARSRWLRANRAPLRPAVQIEPAPGTSMEPYRPQAEFEFSEYDRRVLSGEFSEVVNDDLPENDPSLRKPAVWSTLQSDTAD